MAQSRSGAASARKATRQHTTRPGYGACLLTVGVDGVEAESKEEATHDGRDAGHTGEEYARHGGEHEPLVWNTNSGSRAGRTLRLEGIRCPEGTQKWAPNEQPSD